MTYDTNVTPTKTYITLGETAKRTGLSKATISRMVKTGKISVKEKGEDGAFRIDPAEITRFLDAARVTRSTRVPKTVDDTDVTTRFINEISDVTPDETGFAVRLRGVRERAELEARVAIAEARLTDIQAQAEARLTDLKKVVDDVKTERDEWRTVAQRTLLTHQPARRGLFAWLTRKAG